MGCFNLKDPITNRDIIYGDKIGCILLEKSTTITKRETYIYDNWLPSSYIFFGEYNDYGNICNIEKNLNTDLIEKYYNIDLQTIMDIIVDDRSLYNSYGKFFNHFFTDNDSLLYTTFKNNIKFCYEHIKSLDDNFVKTFEDECSLVFEYELPYLKLVFTSNLKTGSTKCVCFRNEDILWSLNFPSFYSISEVCDKLKDKNIYLVFSDEIVTCYKKIQNLEIMFFSTDIFEFLYRDKGKNISYSNTEIKLFKLTENICDSIDEIVKDEMPYFEKQLDLSDKELYDKLFLKELLNSLNYGSNDLTHFAFYDFNNNFKKLTNIYLLNLFEKEYVTELSKCISDFTVLIDFMNSFNIVFKPSNYAGQQYDRDEELEFFNWLNDNTKKLYIDRVLQNGEYFTKDDFNEEELYEKQTYKFIGGEFDMKEVVCKNKKLFFISSDCEVDIYNIDFDYLCYC